MLRVLLHLLIDFVEVTLPTSISVLCTYTRLFGPKPCKHKLLCVVRCHTFTCTLCMDKTVKLSAKCAMSCRMCLTEKVNKQSMRSVNTLVQIGQGEFTRRLPEGFFPRFDPVAKDRCNGSLKHFNKDMRVVWCSLGHTRQQQVLMVTRSSEYSLKCGCCLLSMMT